MTDINREPRLGNPLDIKSLLLKPLGSLTFRARLLKIGYDTGRQARQEMWGSSVDDEKLQARQDELYDQRRVVLVHETIDQGQGSQRFLSKLAVAAGELYEQAPVMEYEVPDHPDFSEAAGFADR